MSEPINTDLAATAAQMLSPEAFEALAAQITAPLRQALETKQEQINRLLGEQASYQDTVRDAMIRWFGDRGIDNSELNELFEELDLDPIEVEFEVEVKVTAIQYITVTVSAVSALAAERLVNDGDEDASRLVEAEIDGHDWQVEEAEAVNVILA